MEKFKTSKSSSYWQNIHLAFSLVSSRLWTLTDEQWGPKKWQMCPTRTGQRGEGYKGMTKQCLESWSMELQGFKELSLQKCDWGQVKGKFPEFAWGHWYSCSHSEGGAWLGFLWQERPWRPVEWTSLLVLYCYSLKEVVDLSSCGRDHWEGPQTWVNEDPDLWGGGVNLSKWGSRGSLFAFFIHCFVPPNSFWPFYWDKMYPPGLSLMLY